MRRGSTPRRAPPRGARPSGGRAPRPALGSPVVFPLAPRFRIICGVPMPSPPIALVHNLRRALRDGDLAEAANVLAHLQHEAPLALETGALELELRVRGK